MGEAHQIRKSLWLQDPRVHQNHGRVSSLGHAWTYSSNSLALSLLGRMASERRLPPIFPSMHPPIYPSFYSFIHPFLHPSIHSPVLHPSLYTTVCLLCPELRIERCYLVLSGEKEEDKRCSHSGVRITIEQTPGLNRSVG